MRIITTLLALLVLSSCGGNNEYFTEDEADFYKGIWSGACHIRSISGKDSYSIKQYEFMNGILYERLFSYEFYDCTGKEALSFERSGKIDEITKVNVDGYDAFCFSLADQDNFMPNSYIFYFSADFLYETIQNSIDANDEVSQAIACKTFGVNVSFEDYYELTN